MTITQEKTATGHMLKVNGSLSIYDVAGIREEILSLLNDPEARGIDFRGVDTCDTAGIQLVIALCKHLENMHHPLTVQGLSHPIMRAATQVGIEFDTGLPVAKEE